MHGRVKILTTEQQKEKQKKIREEKVKAYNEAMDRIQKIRGSRSHWEESLLLTGQILTANPDVLTLWNIRREILVEAKTLAEECLEEFILNTSTQNLSRSTMQAIWNKFIIEKMIVDDFIKLCKEENIEILDKTGLSDYLERMGPVNYLNQLKKELSLTEMCLRANPKSYSAWHHRCWVLDNLKVYEADVWQKEVAICDRYLNLDARNFHGWDHRKEVGQKALVPVDEAFAFTTKHIEKDFSNYSAWHARSRLLPLVAPDPSGRFPISEEQHSNELQMVQDAAFTDPNDQSAWIYLRWLLGLRSAPLQLLSLQRDLSLKKLVVTLSRRIILDANGPNLHVEINGVACEHIKWETTQNASYVFMFRSQDMKDIDGDILVTLTDNGNRDAMKLLSKENVKIKNRSFVPDLSDDLKIVIQTELNNCMELLELEPGSKWPLLTLISLKKILDPIESHEAVLSAISDLKKEDEKRAGYYDDLASRYIMEYEITKQDSSGKVFKIIDKPLSNLYHMQYLSHIEEIELSGIGLKDSHLVHLNSLINCKTLILKNNCLKSLKMFPNLEFLQKLDLTKNQLEEPKKDTVYKLKCKFLHITSCSDEYLDAFKSCLPDTAVICE